MSEKKNEMVAVATQGTFNASVIDTAKFAVISDKETKSFATQVAKAMTTEDTAKGAQAYFINQIHKRIASGETIENAKKLGDEKPCKNLPEFCERYFGLSRSQAFNLSRAGAMLKVSLTEEGKIVYTDVFTDDVNTPNFSNTVLIRFADFIGDVHDKNADNAKLARGRVSLINALVKNGKIKPDMSVNAIMEIVRGTDGGTQNGANGKANGKDGKANGKDGKANGKASGKNKVTEYAVPLTKKQALDLKTEMIRFTSSKDYDGKLPMMTAFINALNEALNPKKK